MPSQVFPMLLRQKFVKSDKSSQGKNSRKRIISSRDPGHGLRQRRMNRKNQTRHESALYFVAEGLEKFEHQKHCHNVQQHVCEVIEKRGSAGDLGVENQR